MENIESMSTEYPGTIYYYAVRDPGSSYPNPQHNVAKRVLQEWDIVFLIQSYTIRHNGIFYVPDENGVDQRYYIHHIPFVDFDLLTAFDVPSVTGFETKYWGTRNRVILS